MKQSQYIKPIYDQKKVILNYVGGKKLIYEDLINNRCQSILFSPNKKI